MYPTASPPPNYSTSAYTEEDYQQDKDVSFEIAHVKFQEIFNRYEINPFFHNYLEKLSTYKPVILCDDSGSMQNPSDMIFEGKRIDSRWKELKLMIKYVYGILGGICQSGIDLYFLNRDRDVHIQDSYNFDKVEPFFSKLPSGCTPLVSKMEYLLTKYHKQKTVYIVITDGSPYNGTDKETKENFIDLIYYRDRIFGIPSSDMPITIIACSDDKDMDYLDKLDELAENVDVLDDYENEKKQVLKARRITTYTYGDHFSRFGLGAIFRELDQLDEPAIFSKNKEKNEKKEAKLHAKARAKKEKSDKKLLKRKIIRPFVPIK
jgi:hypothetical protein